MSAVGMPLSLEDVSKALTHIFTIFDEIVRRAGNVVDQYRTHQRELAAKAVNNLRFGEGGALTSVAKIAAGNFEPMHFEAIERQLYVTAADVDTTIETLMMERNMDLIRKQIGIDAVLLLEKIIHGKEGKGGKGAVRLALLKLVEYRNDHQQAKGMAENILTMIRELNNDIIELHNLLLKQPNLVKNTGGGPAAPIGNG